MPVVVILPDLNTIWAIFGTSNFGFRVETQVCFWYLGIWSLIVLLMLHDPAFIAIPVLTVVQHGGAGDFGCLFIDCRFGPKFLLVD